MYLVVKVFRLPLGYELRLQFPIRRDEQRVCRGRGVISKPGSITEIVPRHESPGDRCPTSTAFYVFLFKSIFEGV